jgi:hypothetical protein
MSHVNTCARFGYVARGRSTYDVHSTFVRATLVVHGKGKAPRRWICRGRGPPGGPDGQAEPYPPHRRPAQDRSAVRQPGVPGSGSRAGSRGCRGVARDARGPPGWPLTAARRSRSSRGSSTRRGARLSNSNSSSSGYGRDAMTGPLHYASIERVRIAWLYWDVCGPVGVDPLIAVAQLVHETAEPDVVVVAAAAAQPGGDRRDRRQGPEDRGAAGRAFPGVVVGGPRARRPAARCTRPRRASTAIRSRPHALPRLAPLPIEKHGKGHTSGGSRRRGGRRTRTTRTSSSRSRTGSPRDDRRADSWVGSRTTPESRRRRAQRHGDERRRMTDPDECEALWLGAGTARPAHDRDDAHEDVEPGAAS